MQIAFKTGRRRLDIVHCDGPAYLKWRLQTTVPYQFLEENECRTGEEDWRGMFLATTSADIFEHARNALAKWGDVEAATQYVNSVETEAALESLRKSVARGTPVGGLEWQQQTNLALSPQCAQEVVQNKKSRMSLFPSLEESIYAVFTT